MNKMNGKGVFKWPNGMKYEGEYEMDKMNGIGTLTWYFLFFCTFKDYRFRPDNKKYIGQWAEGKQHGKGCLIYSDLSKIDGVWKNGVKQE